MGILRRLVRGIDDAVYEAQMKHHENECNRTIRRIERESEKAQRDYEKSIARRKKQEEMRNR